MGGSDNTISFAGKASLPSGRHFNTPVRGIITALINLGTTNEPQTQIASVMKLRWWLFKKKQAELKRLLPSPDALLQAILHAHHQAIVWNHDTVAQPVIPPPENYLACSDICGCSGDGKETCNNSEQLVPWWDEMDDDEWWLWSWL